MRAKTDLTLTDEEGNEKVIKEGTLFEVYEKMNFQFTLVFTIIEGEDYDIYIDEEVMDVINLYEISEEKLEHYTEVQIKFEAESRYFLLKFDKETTLSERTLSMNCSLSELVYMETDEDREAFGEAIEIELEDSHEIDEILSDEIEEYIIGLVETLSEV
jgi:hypothetical protein